MRADFRLHKLIEAVFLCLSVLSCVDALKCWTSELIPHSVPLENATITLAECAENEGCCKESSSMPGWKYGCVLAIACPRPTEISCGKHTDGSWCYCQSHEDENCTPLHLRTGGTEGSSDAIEEQQASSSASTTPLRCHVGMQSWEAPTTDADPPVPLQDCAEQETCCYRLRSLDGTKFACAADCPLDWNEPCGPTPPAATGNGWCYCRDHTDVRCSPTAFNSLNRNATDETAV